MLGRIAIVAAVLLCGPCGCAVRQVQSDQDQLRSALLALCTNQVLDNLVRASNGLPIIHLDYTNANAQFTLDMNASVGDTAVNTHSNTLLALTLGSSLVTRTFANAITGSLGASQTNQVAVTATPVTTTNQVYDAYLSYLTLPGSLMVTRDPPPPGAAHVCTCFRKEYYWVPVEFREEYFDLAAITTAQRTKSLLAAEDFWRVKVIGFEPSSKPFEPGSLVTLKLDKSVPNTTGQIKFADSGDRYRFAEFPSDENNTYYVTNHVKIALKVPPEELQYPFDAYLKLKQLPPPPTTRDLLDRIPFRIPQTDAASAHAGAAASGQPAASSDPVRTGSSE